MVFFLVPITALTSVPTCEYGICQIWDLLRPKKDQKSPRICIVTIKSICDRLFNGTGWNEVGMSRQTNLDYLPDPFTREWDEADWLEPLVSYILIWHPEYVAVPTSSLIFDGGTKSWLKFPHSRTFVKVPQYQTKFINSKYFNSIKLL